MPDNITTDVNRCARCRETHHSLEFRPFTNPVGAYSHWATCPTSSEPILLAWEPTEAGIYLKEALADHGFHENDIVELLENWPQPYDPMMAGTMCWIADTLGTPEIKLAACKLYLKTLDSCMFWKMVDNVRDKMKGVAKSTIPEPKLLMPNGPIPDPRMPEKKRR